MLSITNEVDPLIFRCIYAYFHYLNHLISYSIILYSFEICLPYSLLISLLSFIVVLKWQFIIDNSFLAIWLFLQNFIDLPSYLLCLVQWCVTFYLLGCVTHYIISKNFRLVAWGHSHNRLLGCDRSCFQVS